MQLSPNRFKQAIGELKPQIGIWSSMCSIIAADLLGTAGFDWVLIDMEHSPNDMMSVLGQLQAYEVGGTSPVVRPPWNDPVTIKRLLDLGVMSLLVPMVQNAEEARAAVRATRYPPNGIRGVSMAHRANRYGRIGDYIERIDKEVCVLVQIETREALDRIEEIAAVEGVDGVFFGPADLSADLGLIGRTTHEDVSNAIAEGARRVAALGKPTGTLIGDMKLIERWLQSGFSFVACGTDLGLLARGAENLRKQVAALSR
ncbi:MAG: HpcH/HpaI aldolase/citrate lyase family protein [Parvibaculaceae bacterium]